MHDSQPATVSVEMAQRLRAALTAQSGELFQLILDPAPEVLRALLKNPLLGEEHLLALLKRRDLREDLIKSICQLERFADCHRLQVVIAAHPATPGELVLTLLPRLFLFELLTICILPTTSPDQKLAAERVILQRLPSTEPGQKLTLARRGTPTLVAELLKEGDFKIMSVCLDSPRLREVAILQFLNGATAKAETISLIARHPRWQSRPNLRLAILKNRKTPAVWFTLFLPHLPVGDVRNLLHSNRLSPEQKTLVRQEFVKRTGGG
jgi:hypothetical protein